MMLIEDFLGGVDVFSTNKSWNPWNGNLELLPGGDHMPRLHAGFVMQAILCGGNWYSSKGCKSLAVDDILLLCPSYPCELDSPRFVYIYNFCSVGCTLLVEERSKESCAQNLLPRVSIRGDCELRHRQCVWKQKWSLKWFSINFSVLTNDSSACVCVCDRWWWTWTNFQVVFTFGELDLVKRFSISVCVSVPLSCLCLSDRNSSYSKVSKLEPQRKRSQLPGFPHFR